jgi:WD40 repeat protein
VKKAVDKTELKYQTTSAVFNDTNEYIFYGGVDNQIKAWNISNEDKEEFTLLGHVDTITGKNIL